jgi:hypothetical protein
MHGLMIDQECHAVEILIERVNAALPRLLLP